MVDRIPVRDASELTQFGLDGSQFRKKGRDKIGGYEFHGPCPRCGGDDRCIVSNGFYNCRNSSACGFKGLLADLNKDRKPLTPEERRKIQRKMEAERQRERRERGSKIKKLTQSKVWETFHINLLNSPEHLNMLAVDGIPLRAVKHFQIGLNPQFNYVYEDAYRTSPALTFPIFRDKWCVNIRCRILADVKGDKYRPYQKGLGISFLPAFFPKSDYVVIVEGEKKAIVLWSNGIPAIGLFGVWSLKDTWARWIREVFKRNYIVFDGDNEQVLAATEAAARKTGGKILTLGGKPDDLIVSGELTIPELIALIVKAETK